ncbi:MAG TPA: hypothetical protein VJK28_01595 [Nitrospiria bacterium]|nr:hypothetical protein [Nitrospiria bacterium]
MKKVFKVLGIILIAAVLFGTGYFVGRLQMVEISQLLSSVRSEMVDKTAGLEQEIQRLRMRIHLVNARDRLMSAHRAASERNFGVTQKELQKAKEELGTARRLADPKWEGNLSGFEAPLDDLIVAAGRADPKLAARVDSLRSDLDRVMGQ